MCIEIFSMGLILNKYLLRSRVVLHQSALKLAGERGKGDELVFYLPFFNGSAKTIKKRVARTVIGKRIT